MAYVSVIGLSLDLVGVVLLGIDLVRVQRSLRFQSAENIRLFNEIFPRFQTLQFERTYLETGVASSEGFDGDGGVDARDLSSTLGAYREQIEKCADGVTDVIEFLQKSATEHAADARRSLSFTYVGIALIVVGFALQMVGLIAVVPSALGVN